MGQIGEFFSDHISMKITKHATLFHLLFTVWRKAYFQIKLFFSLNQNFAIQPVKLNVYRDFKKMRIGSNTTWRIQYKCPTRDTFKTSRVSSTRDSVTLQVSNSKSTWESLSHESKIVIDTSGSSGLQSSSWRECWRVANLSHGSFVISFLNQVTADMSLTSCVSLFNIGHRAARYIQKFLCLLCKNIPWTKMYSYTLYI